MKQVINFLTAAVPLTKTFHKNGTKDAYPLVKNFTSHEETISTIDDFYKHIVNYSKEGACLLKGRLTRPLVNEPRANTTRTNDVTGYICLDFDDHKAKDIETELHRIGLGDVSYVIQYSASHGMPGTEGTINAHVFMLLEKMVQAPSLKAWLMKMNLDNFRDQVLLSKTYVHLTWPMDITICQNDKLIYIAPPKFNGLTDPLKGKRIALVKKKKAHITADAIPEMDIAPIRNDANKLKNERRVALGLKAHNLKTKFVKSIEVTPTRDVCRVTDVRDCGDYVRLNINGGDSWAYWHHKNDFEIIHSFKDDTAYLAKELVPDYYKDCAAERADANATPNERGDLLLAFRDKKSAEYFNGTWNPETNHLELFRARNETQLDHWMKSHGQILGDFIPVWDIIYDPHQDWIVDEEGHRINSFRGSKFLRCAPDKRITPSDFPNIYRIIRHMLGEKTDPNDAKFKDTKVSDHFLNWFAVIFQLKAKPITAWVTHGTEGTGKGYFMLRIVRPLFGDENVAEVSIGQIEDTFNGWQEGKLFVNVNEIDVNDFTAKGRVEAKFKMLITDNIMPVRRMRQTTSFEQNFGSYLFSSNKRQPVVIPKDDRRYNVGLCQRIKLSPPKEEDVAAELEAFAAFLKAHPADIKQANTILHTESREQMQALSENSLEESCQAILDGDFDFFWMQRISDSVIARAPHLYEEARTYGARVKDIARDIMEGVPTLSRDDIGILLAYVHGKAVPTSPNKLTSLLRHHGIVTTRTRHKNEMTYAMPVNWKISDPVKTEIAEVLNLKPVLKRAK